MEDVSAAHEEVLTGGGGGGSSNHIVKGKRTKRQRPQSPIPFVVSSGDAGGFDSNNVKDKICQKSNNNIDFLSSPASSGEYLDSTEEDEDMANCLILLAQCRSRELPKQADHNNNNNNNNNDIHDEIGQIHSKFNSRRFLEAPSSGAGKAGYYVYECKTCNRTFPSFQALGGHRASHKKPKAMNDERINIRSQFVVSSDEEEGGNFKNVSSLSLQLSNNNRSNNLLYSNNKNNTNKVHECSICGAEFISGQALGGHMRRHRAPIGTNTTLSLTPMVALESEQTKKPRNVLSLDLDLNLPAPEDDLRESKLPFVSKQQQQPQQQQQKSPLAFSAPTLVDCHY